jgi:hypothetical protein
MRRSKLQCFSRSAIESVFSPPNFSLSNRLKVSALGEIRVGKIDLGLQGLGCSFMLGKFVSVVHRQRMDLTFDLTQCPYEYVGDVIGMLREDGLHAGEASFSVHQGQQAPPTVTAHHQIDLPITDSSFFIDSSGTVINRNPVGNRTFIRCFGRNAQGALSLAQVGMKSTTAVSTPMVFSSKTRTPTRPKQPVSVFSQLVFDIVKSHPLTR